MVMALRVEGDKGVNPDRPCGRVRGDSFSFDSKGTQTRVDADGVITRLKASGMLGLICFGRSILSHPASECPSRRLGLNRRIA